MRVLLLSAYDAASHRYWREGLVLALPHFQWTVLSLPARYFNWRIRGNSMSWAFLERPVLEAEYDVVLATSMVDLSTLRGLVPAIATVPTIVYCHENQFAYPVNAPVNDSTNSANVNAPNVQSVEPQMVNLYTALCAQRLLFNSEYNRSSFLAGVEALLAKLPDFVPKQLLKQLQNSLVLPVPLADTLFEREPELLSHMHQQAQPPHKPQPLHIVWNHRWEYDKGPERLGAIIELLEQTAVPVCWSIIGEQFRRWPAVFDRIKQILDNSKTQQLLTWGYVEKQHDYHQLLASADCVLSTSLHDFQGLSVLEAAALGCTPLVPDRLAYAELFEQQFRYASSLQNPADETASLLAQLVKLSDLKLIHAALPKADIGYLSWSSLRQDYEALFAELVG